MTAITSLAKGKVLRRMAASGITTRQQLVLLDRSQKETPGIQPANEPLGRRFASLWVGCVAQTAPQREGRDADQTERRGSSGAY